MNIFVQNNSENKQFFETIIYTVLALLSLGVVYYLFYYDPVNYVIVFIAEDSWAEYGTSVSYAISGILLLLLSFREEKSLQRVLYGLIGIAAILIAGEEISWGQRLIGLGTISSIMEYNVQGEITLHNLKVFEAINSRSHTIAAYLILIWSLISIALSVRTHRLKERLLNIGLPILPMKLLPMFLLVAYFFLFHPTAKADEVGEFFLGIAVMMWAVDLFLAHYWDERPERFVFIAGSVGALFVSAFVVACLMYVHTGALGWRLNKMASRDYPNFRMYEQAQVLYEYIYQNPEYIRSDTRKNHAEMLLEAGKQAESSEILSQESIESDDE